MIDPLTAFFLVVHYQENHMQAHVISKRRQEWQGEDGWFLTLWFKDGTLCGVLGEVPERGPKVGTDVEVTFGEQHASDGSIAPIDLAAIKVRNDEVKSDTERYVEDFLEYREIKQIAADMDALLGELAAIDAALARRPALDDCQTRADKVWKACETVASQERKMVKMRAALRLGPELAETSEQAIRSVAHLECEPFPSDLTRRDEILQAMKEAAK
jgi:hypothetical protein